MGDSGAHTCATARRNILLASSWEAYAARHNGISHLNPQHAMACRISTRTTHARTAMEDSTSWSSHCDVSGKRDFNRSQAQRQLQSEFQAAKLASCDDQILHCIADSPGTPSIAAKISRQPPQPRRNKTSKKATVETRTAHCHNAAGGKHLSGRSKVLDCACRVVAVATARRRAEQATGLYSLFMLRRTWS